MSYRLKNSDFKPFLGFLEGKVNDLWVYIGEGIGVYFWDDFAREKCTPGRGEGRECDGVPGWNRMEIRKV